MIPKHEFQESLLSWYDHSKRILPWRDNPNPYHVWISEIMLQQTRVETVIPYFNRFIKELPTIEDLAMVDDDKLNKLWEGLGYYSRVRNLKKAANQVVADFHGVLPQNQSDLESLIGIGSYTSGAILSIAFNQKYTAVDGNVLRVFARLTANKNNIKDPQIKREIRSVVDALLPDQRVGDFNQGLMEIGATVCKPNGVPDCVNCPLNIYCEGYQKNLTDTIPMKQIKQARKKEKRTVFVLQYDDKYILERRPDKGLLAGLYQFPNIEGFHPLNAIQKRFPSALSIRKIAASKHIFSHIEWAMEGYHVVLSQLVDDGILVSTKELVDIYSIPTAFKAFKKHILGGKS